MDQAAFDRMVQDHDQLVGAKRKALDEAKDKWTQLQAEQEQAAAKAKERFDADWKRAQTDVLAKLEKDVPIFKKTGDAEIDAKIEAAKEKVKALDISKISNDDLVTAFYKEAAYPIFVEQIAALYQTQAALEARITKLQGSTPGAGEGDTGDGNPPPKKYDTAIDSLREKLGGILPA